jgi:predicted GNAT superfamily acetyltransferase
VNLNRLGALGVAYLVNCYGEMDDPLNAGAPSDRLLLEWCLESPRVEAARQGKLAAQGTVRVPIPANVHALRRDDRAEVRAWRFRVRDALVPLLEAGHRVTGFDRAASSLLLAPAAAAEEGVP